MIARILSVSILVCVLVLMIPFLIFPAFVFLIVPMFLMLFIVFRPRRR